MVLLITRKKIDLSSDDLIIFKDGCELKKFKDTNYVILLDDIKVEEDGLIKEFDYFFEEILITLNVGLVITTINDFKLQEICEIYNLPLIKIN